jgi:hypothetical protein
LASQLQYELEGIDKLRSGILLLIVVPLLLLAASIVIAIGAFIATRPAAGAVVSVNGATRYYVVHMGPTPLPLAASLGAAIGVAAIAAVLLVVSFLALGRLSVGFKALEAAGKGGWAGVAGVWLIIAAVIVALVGAATFMFGGFIAVDLSFIIAVVGFILIGVGLFEVGSYYNDALLEAGGILTAIPLVITSFIGLIISYVGLGEVERRLREAAPKA